MKNVILVGQMNEAMRDVYNSLIAEFSVQLCANDEESFNGIVKIFKPDLVVIGCFGLEEVNRQIFELLNEKYTDLPVLIVANTEDRYKYEAHCINERFELLLRPTTNTKLIGACRRLLNGEKNVDIEIVKSNEKKKILVVDDSPLVLRNLKEILKEKYTVFFANSGEQALKFIPMREPDLVLLDYEMPGMNGKETFEAMCEDDFAKNIPVIFLTGMSKKDQVYGILQHNPANYILKPPSRDELLSRIEAVFNK